MDALPAQRENYPSWKWAFFSLLFPAFMVVPTTASAAQPEDEPIVKVVQTALPAVVNIYTESSEQVADPYDTFFQRFYGFGSVHRIIKVPVRSLGSGILVTPDGYIVTNQHVVSRARESKIKITLNDKTDYEARFIRDDPDLDLALIKIDGDKPFPTLDIRQLSPNLLGQTVIAIGNPIGYESSVSRGILSATDRTLTVDDITYDSLIQTDAAINPGNSGGPLIDIGGKFVGLNSAKAGMGIDNIGFAIPGERVAAFVDDSIAIAEGKKTAPPQASLTAPIRERFGLGLQEMDAALASTFGLRPGIGLVVVEVEPGSPAAEAGIQRGMLVTGIGANRTRAEADIPRSVLKLKKGDMLKFNLLLLLKSPGGYMSQAGSAEMRAR